MSTKNPVKEAAESDSQKKAIEREIRRIEDQQMDQTCGVLLFSFLLLLSILIILLAIAGDI